MAKNIYQIVYVSKAIGVEDGPYLEQIGNTSQRNNAARNISGFLLFTGTHYIQLLEGDKLEVENLFQTIRADERHSQVSMIFADLVDERLCPEWAMKVEDMTKGDTSRFSSIERFTRLFLANQFSLPAEQVGEFVRRIRAQLAWAPFVRTQSHHSE